MYNISPTQQRIERLLAILELRNRVKGAPRMSKHEHFRVSIAALETEHDEHQYPWETTRHDRHLALAIALALEGSSGCMATPPVVIAAEVIQHLWEGHGIDPDHAWPEGMERFELLYKAALELLDSHANRKE